MAEGEIEDELRTGPLGTEADVLIVIVDDESSQTQNTSIVSAHVVSG